MSFLRTIDRQIRESVSRQPLHFRVFGLCQRQQQLQTIQVHNLHLPIRCIPCKGAVRIDSSSRIHHNARRAGPTFDGLIRELLRDLALQRRVGRLGVRNEPLQVHSKRFRERFVLGDEKEYYVSTQRHDNDPTQAGGRMGDCASASQQRRHQRTVVLEGELLIFASTLGAGVAHDDPLVSRSVRFWVRLAGFLVRLLVASIVDLVQKNHRVENDLWSGLVWRTPLSIINAESLLFGASRVWELATCGNMMAEENGGGVEETEVETVMRLQAVDIRDLYPDKAPEDALSRVCLLCGTSLKDKTHNLTRHFERHHAGALLQLMEQRRQSQELALVSGAQATSSEGNRAARDHHHGPTKKTKIKVPQLPRVDAAAPSRMLMQWLAQEHLPLSVVDSESFRAFSRALNAGFELPQLQDMKSVVQALASAAQDKSSPGVAVEMNTLIATCRCPEDVPLVTYQKIPCGILSAACAQVKVLRASASLFDVRVCHGQIRGKNGILGRSFVGVKSSVTVEADHTVRVQAAQRVLALPYLSSSDASSKDVTALGVSASEGSLSEYVELPFSMLYEVPTEIPDDIALLADDHALIISIAKIIEMRDMKKLAIIVDGLATCVVGLLTRYLHHTGPYQASDIFVFSTAAMDSQDWAKYALFTPLDIHNTDALDDVLSDLGPLDGCIDFCGTESSAELVINLIEPMGTIVMVDRVRFELQPRTNIAMDINSVVVKELEVLTVGDCHDTLPAALAYLSGEANHPDACQELRSFLSEPIGFDSALTALQKAKEQELKRCYLQVVF